MVSDVERQRRAAIKGNRFRTEKFLDQLECSGIKSILITPFPFDQSGTQKTDRLASASHNHS